MLVTLRLAVTATQTYRFQAALEGQAREGEKRGCPHPTAPSQLPNHISNSLSIVSSPINIHKRLFYCVRNFPADRQACTPPC